ncbi:MAG: cation:dicarboxylase symporter family transporter [Acidobacteria bacterium]|nr:cation:dicarboxylase symporter family transporter [Acidobacteriota bacterium]
MSDNATVTTTQSASSLAVAPSRARARRARVPGITTQIVVGMVVGILIGYGWPDFGVAIRPLADAFLRMIRMILAPLLFSMIIVGIAGSGDFKAMGRIGLKAVVYFQVVTTVALLLGFALVNLFRPGAGLAVPMDIATGQSAGAGQAGAGGWDTLLSLFPTSVVDAMARGDILQIVVFSTLFGISLAAIGEKGRPLFDALDSTAQVMFVFTRYVMKFAPIGVMAAMAATVGGKGFMILGTLAKLVVLMYAGAAVFALVVLASVSFLIGVPFYRFLRAIREPLLIAFGTTSSAAALPKALEVMERFGVPKNIVGFVLPTGGSLNMAGTALYLPLATIFVAQLTGIEFTWGQQVAILLTLMVTSKGVGGGARGALVVLTATLTTFGLPLEGAAILLGIDHIMDMARTTLNVMGNCLASAVIARWEGVFDGTKMRAAAL